MSKVVRVYEAGGPEVLRIEDVDLGAPGEGEVLLRQTAVGVNLIDVYHRTETTGQYAIARPAVLGVEGAGVIEAIGPGVSGLGVGDRAGYLSVLGAYAERRLMKAASLIRLPESITDAQAAAGLVKGITAEYLLTLTYPVGPNDTVLVHAAAGGVGQLMVQWAKHLGATVIGTVGSAAKAEIARGLGCDAVFVIGVGKLPDSVRAFTQGRGVDVVYDSLGKDSFLDSLSCIRPLGMMVNYGQASGPVPPFDIGLLAQKGSIYLAKPTLATFVADPARRQRLADGLFKAVADGVVDIAVARELPLDRVADAHRDLEARKTTGSTVLIP